MAYRQPSDAITGNISFSIDVGLSYNIFLKGFSIQIVKNPIGIMGFIFNQIPLTR